MQQLTSDQTDDSATDGDAAAQLQTLTQDTTYAVAALQQFMQDHNVAALCSALQQQDSYVRDLYADVFTFAQDYYL
jgi:hypothetical protein